MTYRLKIYVIYNYKEYYFIIMQRNVRKKPSKTQIKSYKRAEPSIINFVWDVNIVLITKRENSLHSEEMQFISKLLKSSIKGLFNALNFDENT